MKPPAELVLADEEGGVIYILYNITQFPFALLFDFDIRRGLQEDVPHTSRVLPEAGPKPKVFGAHRYRAGGQQTIPVRVS